MNPRKSPSLSGLLIPKNAPATVEPLPTPADLPPDRVFMSVRLDRALHRRLRIYAVHADRQMQDVIAEALAIWLDTNETGRS